jgi:hypothetical protein
MERAGVFILVKAWFAQGVERAEYRLVGDQTQNETEIAPDDERQGACRIPTRRSLQEAREADAGKYGPRGATVLVLWRFFSWSARFAMLKAWVKVRTYVVNTALLYFNRLKRYGLRRVTCNIAVVCSVTIWIAIIAAFAFSEHLLEAAVVIAVMVLAFFLAG